MQPFEYPPNTAAQSTRSEMLRTASLQRRTTPEGLIHFVEVSGEQLLHCEDGPARILKDGSCEWWHYGLRHREDGPAVIFRDGVVQYWVRGLLHREDGPAVMAPTGLRMHYVNSEKHRVDGPAVIGPDASETYYFHNKMLDREDWLVQVVFEETSDPQLRHAVRALAPTWEGSPATLLETVRNLSELYGAVCEVTTASLL